VKGRTERDPERLLRVLIPNRLNIGLLARFSARAHPQQRTCCWGSLRPKTRLVSPLLMMLRVARRPMRLKAAATFSRDPRHMHQRVPEARGKIGETIGAASYRLSRGSVCSPACGAPRKAHRLPSAQRLERRSRCSPLEPGDPNRASIRHEGLRCLCHLHLPSLVHRR
jgi:hypothetical protein